MDAIIQNIDNNLAYLNFDSANYGIDYKNALSKSNVSKEQNLKFYQKLKFLSPKVCLSQTLRPRFEDLPFFNEFVSESNFSTLENQWNKLHTVTGSTL